MAALTASTRKKAAEATLQFDWLAPLDRPFWRVRDVAAALDCSSTTVEEMFAEKCNRFEAGRSAEKKREERRQRAAATGRDLAGGTRPMMRIPRAFLVTALVASAKYNADDKVEAVTGLAREFSGEECLKIAAAFSAAAQRAPLSR